MSVQDLSKLDYMYKDIAFDKIKTDLTSNLPVISSENEGYYNNPILNSENVWTDASDVKIKGKYSIYCQKYTIRMTPLHNQDISELRGTSWATGYKNWIPESYNPDFTPIFYSTNSPAVGSPLPESSSVGFFSVASSSEYPYVFDYGTGILTFSKDVPRLPVDLTNVNSQLWISGYTYTGKILSTVLDTIESRLGVTGPTGPMGPGTSIVLDGWDPYASYLLGPVLDCGFVV